MIRPSRVFILFVLLAFGPVPFAATPAESAAPSLTLEQKVGQLFLIGFPQKSVDSKVKSLLRDIKPGGLILFRRNLGDPDAIRSFTKALSEEGRLHAGVEPFIAVDQEGGPVARISIYPSLPSAYSIGRADREDLSLGLGEETGKILRWSGFNMNFAPVLDLSDPLKPSFIGPRSFGADPDRAGRIGTAFAEGLRRQGVLPTAKHFPGLGATVVDPHRKAARQIASKEELSARDMKPFETYAKLGPRSALMISQLSYPALDPSGVPAPFSRKILHDLLREELKYEGLLVTDDLQMKGTSTVLRPEEAALQSLKAGADLVMLSWSAEAQRKAVSRVLGAVKSGEWPVDELDQRVNRILEVKRGLTKAPGKIRIGRGPRGIPATRRLEILDLALLDSSLKAPVPDGMPAQAGVDCVVSAQRKFLSSYRQGTKSAAVRLIEIEEKTTTADLKSEAIGCGRIIFAINGKKTAILAAAMPASMRRKTLAVNLGMPLLISEKKSFGARVDVGYPHLHAGFRIAQWLQAARANRSVSSTNQ